jgi:hypothetical protein
MAHALRVIFTVRAADADHSIHLARYTQLNRWRDLPGGDHG